MKTPYLNATLNNKSLKLSFLFVSVLMLFVLSSSLFADDKLNNTSSSTKYGRVEKDSNKSQSKKEDKEKVADKKEEKQKQKEAKAQKKAKKQEESYQNKKDTGKYSEKGSSQVEYQNNTQKKNYHVEQNTSEVQQHGNNNTNAQVEQNHSHTLIKPQSSDHVEQHTGSGLIPDVTDQHGGGNHSPNDHIWSDPFPNHNHLHIGHDGYYHDEHQHYFHQRRHYWHERYPFFSFRLRFDLDSGFPYNDLYYYPTDYVFVESRLSVVVLPFTYKNDEYRINDDITDKLISALDDLRRFRVIERWTVEKIMSRNDIRTSDLVETYPAKRVGRLAEADLVIMGKIDKSSDHVTLSVRCIDPDTGETVVEETATSEYTDNRNVDRLVKYLAVLIYNDLPLSEGIITDVEDDEVEINIGSDDGLSAGMRCIVFREGSVVRHPYTGEYLGQKMKKAGEVFIVDVREDTSTARIIKKIGRLRTGDKVIVK